MSKPNKLFRFFYLRYGNVAYILVLFLMHGRTNIVDSICLELHDGGLKITKTTKIYSVNKSIQRGLFYTLIFKLRNRPGDGFYLDIPGS